MGHQATSLAAGVVITGGVPTETLHAPPESFFAGQPTARARRFEPASANVVELPLMIVARAFHGAASPADGDVLVTGGLSDHGASTTATTEIFVSSDDTWVSGPPMDVARQRHSLVAHGDAIIACGGVEWDGREATGVDDAAALDLAAFAWRLLAAPPPEVEGLASPGVAFGIESGLVFVRSTDALRLVDGAWRPLDWQASFWGGAATPLSGGGGLVAGLGYYGGLAGALHDGVADELIDVAMPQVTQPTSTWPVTLTALDDGSVLVVGDAGAARWSP